MDREREREREREAWIEREGEKERETEMEREKERKREREAAHHAQIRQHRCWTHTGGGRLTRASEKELDSRGEQLGLDGRVGLLLPLVDHRLQQVPAKRPRCS